MDVHAVSPGSWLFDNSSFPGPGPNEQPVERSQLVHDPRALILDEPATSLDLRARRELREILRKIARSPTSVILVTHDPADIFPEISRVILLKDGTVLRDGRKQDVLASAHLSSLFGMPVELVERNGYYHLLDG